MGDKFQNCHGNISYVLVPICYEERCQDIKRRVRKPKNTHVKLFTNFTRYHLITHTYFTDICLHCKDFTTFTVVQKLFTTAIYPYLNAQQY